MTVSVSQKHLAAPIRVDVGGRGDGPPACAEEVSAEPGDLVASDGYRELPLEHLTSLGIEGGHR